MIALPLIQLAVDQHHALRGKQHLGSQRDFLRAQPFERVEGLFRHRDMVGQKEARIAGEHLLANGWSFPAHHEQLVIFGQGLDQPLEAHGLHADA